MTRPEFEKLVLDYGDASFDCGEWDDVKEDGPYETAYAKSETAKAALFAAFDAFIGDRAGDGR